MTAVASAPETGRNARTAALDDGRHRLKLALMLDGDPGSAGPTATKFGEFVAALDRAVHVVGIHDLRLTRHERLLAALLTFRPNRKAWREHYRKNPLTFWLRSRASGRWLHSLQHSPEIVLQIGAMSRPGVPENLPYALYLDFTSELTLREWPARAPMFRAERFVWKRQEARTYRDATVIFCRGSHVAESLSHDYGIAPHKIHVVGAGANVSLPDLRFLSKRDEHRVLFIGSDFRRKGGDVLLDAWPRVLERIPDAKLLMVGPTPRPLPVNVETNDGRWDPLRITSELRRSSLFVMPSRCETWGDVFIEAMSYGVPCIGTTMDAMPEIIEDGVTGYVVPPDNAAALADRIITLLTEPERAAQFSAASRRRVEERFLWDSVVANMARVLNDAIDSDARPSAPLR